MKKILIVVPSFDSGGTVSSLINFVSTVDKSRFEINVFAITNSGSNKKYVAEHCRVVGDQNNSGEGYAMSSAKLLRSKVFAMIKSCKKILERLNIDISPFLFKIYAQKLDTGNYDYILAFQEGQATLFCSYFKHGTKVAWVRSEYTRFSNKIGHKYDVCYKYYDKIVSVSKAALSSFLSVLPQYKDRSFVQYNFLNDKRILSLSNDKVENIWDSDVFIIVTLGRIDPVKRVSEIPRLCDEIRSFGYKFKWVIIGGIAVTEEYKLLVDNIEKYNVKDLVITVGNKPNPYPYLKKCDLLVSLSTSETFNNTLTEAKILGIPVVTTDYPCSYESIENGKEGIITPFDDVTQVISDMICNKSNNYSSIKEYLSSYQYDKESILKDLYTNILI